MFEFELNDEQRCCAQWCVIFNAEIKPIASKIDEEEHIPESLLRK